MKPTDKELRGAHKFEQRLLERAISGKLVVLVDSKEDVGVAAQEEDDQEDSESVVDNKKPFSVDPNNIKNLKLEELNIRAIEEFEKSIPEGQSPDPSDYPEEFKTKKDAIAYLSQNFGS